MKQRELNKRVQNADLQNSDWMCRICREIAQFVCRYFSRTKSATSKFYLQNSGTEHIGLDWNARDKNEWVSKEWFREWRLIYFRLEVNWVALLSIVMRVGISVDEIVKGDLHCIVSRNTLMDARATENYCGQLSERRTDNH